ncbi:MAG: hypothetical protein ACOC1D_05725 [Prolixibacteraceae bacterium]
MNLITMTGAFVITLGLLSYGLGSISLQRFKVISSGVLIFLTLGLILDITANILFLIGNNHLFSLRRLPACSALFIMLINVIWIWRVYYLKTKDRFAGKQLLLYSKVAFGWWLIVYMTVILFTIWK